MCRITREQADRLVEMLAEGEKSHAEIAEALGLDERVVAQVSRGEKRPKLQARIQAAEQGLIAEARRIGAGCAKEMLNKHIKIGKDGNDETARKCREFLLTTFVKGASVPERSAPAPAQGRALRRKDLDRWAKENGGPES